MKTNQILSNITSNGGFDNFNKWNQKEIAEWVFNSFVCSKYVANNVAFHLVN